MKKKKKKKKKMMMMMMMMMMMNTHHTALVGKFQPSHPPTKAPIPHRPLGAWRRHGRPEGPRSDGYPQNDPLIFVTWSKLTLIIPPCRSFLYGTKTSVR